MSARALLGLALLRAALAAEGGSVQQWAREVLGGGSARQNLPGASTENLRFFRELAAGQLDAGEEGRRLQQGGCFPPALTILAPPTWTSFQECLAKKYDIIDHSIIGAEVAAIAECWCQYDVTKLIEEFGCAEHVNFRMWCDMECNPDCASANATSCYSKCPALCLEEDYAPEDCACREAGCDPYVICIAERAANDTAAGGQSQICDDRSFQQSQEIADYNRCLTEQPMRTNWHRHNAKSHCICKSGLHQALQDHNCCGAEWAKPSCDLTCKTEAECSTTEAQTCLTTCRETCHQLHPQMITSECVESCFNGTCSDFKSCAPLELLEYEYVCSDGSKPFDNGCCEDKKSFLEQDCPGLCGVKRNYLIHGKLQCQCFECPVDNAAREETMKKQVAEQVLRTGEVMMTDICSQVNLPDCPSESMQEMLEERNQQLQQSIADHDGVPNQVLEDTLKVSSSKYNARILLEAHRLQDCAAGTLSGRECGEGPPHTGRDPEDREETRREETRNRPQPSNNLPIIVGLIAGGIIIALLAIIIFMCCIRKKVPQQSAENASNPWGPRDGDSQVVVGRPVAPGEREAASGAPVTTDPKAQAEDPKGAGNV